MPVAVITGSSSFARNGYSVLLHAHRNVAGLQETANRIRALHTPRDADSLEARLRCITSDIACPAACRSLVQAAFAWQGSVDVWVNNAGADVLTGSSSSQPFEERLQLLLNVDVCGTIRLCRLVCQELADRSITGGAITNIGWDQASLGMEGEPGQLFCTSKSAIESFSRALAMSVAPQVRVNCVCPGWIQTSWGVEQASDYWDQRATNESLLQRWGTPQDVACCIRWLASSDAAFINGQSIAVNGGRRFSAPPSRES